MAFVRPSTVIESSMQYSVRNDEQVRQLVPRRTSMATYAVLKLKFGTCRAGGEHVEVAAVTSEVEAFVEAMAIGSGSIGDVQRLPIETLVRMQDKGDTFVTWIDKFWLDPWVQRPTKLCAYRFEPCSCGNGYLGVTSVEL